MKTLIYAFTTIMAVSQPQPVSYKITGHIEGNTNIKDNTLAILVKTETNDLSEAFMDTARIENRQFIFEGKNNSAEFAQIYFFKEGEYIPYTENHVNLILEDGAINIKCQEDMNTISGTAGNDILNSYITKQNHINGQITTTLAELDSSGKNITQEQRNKNNAKIKALNQQKTDLTRTYIEDNINNIVGYTLFIQNRLETYDLQEQEDIISRLPETYAKKQAITEIKKDIALSQKTAIGQKFTNLTMKTPEGKDLSLSEIVSNNKITVVSFWASWSAPSCEDIPYLTALYKELKPKGLEIIGISLDENTKDWVQAIENLKMTWPQISDLKGWNCEGAQIYNFHSIPSTILIDRNGTIIDKDLRRKELEMKLNELLK